MRVAVGGISHETCTYADATTGLTVLEDFRRHRGAEILEVNEGASTAVTGIVGAGAEQGWSVVPTFYAVAEPAGTIAAAAWASLKADMLDSVRLAMGEEGGVDCVCLSLHGAGVAEGIEDVEADLGAALRELVGPDVPLTCTLDLHGNISEGMSAAYDLMLGCHLYPHTDFEDRGRELVGLCAEMLAGRLASPVTHIEHLPLMLPPQPTAEGFPEHAMNVLCHQLEETHAEAGLLDVTVFHGFHLADIENTAVHVVAIAAAGGEELAVRCARAVGAWVWGRRRSFIPPLLSSTEAVDAALSILADEGGAGANKPVVINEASDNCGGGAPGDATHLLRALLTAAPELPPNTAVAFSGMIDPAVADQAHKAGVGATIAVELGGKADPSMGGAPLFSEAYVKCLSDGRFTLSHWAPGLRVNMGRCARLVIGGIDVVVASRTEQTLEAGLLELHGVDVSACQIVGLKSEAHFRAGFTHLAREIVTADDPGLTTARVESFVRQRKVRPLWPQDDDATYEWAEVEAEALSRL